MGILDFREIRSPNPNHKSGKNMTLGVSNLPDDFELFAQEFFGVVRRMRIFKCVSNGADGGIDLGVEESSGGVITRWLVSCKHKAHSNTPVVEDEEKNIIERLAAWECDGFIPFYTTPPSSKVETLIGGVEKFGKYVERYFKDRIERELLDNPVGAKIAARYFPLSMTNHYGRIIETLSVYSDEDVVLENNVAAIRGMSRCFSGATDDELAAIKKQLVKYANVLATMEQHKPYFVMAMREAIAIAPDFFILKQPLNKIENLADVVPTWDSYWLYRCSLEQRGLSFLYFVAAVWSFWDWSRANEAFAKMRAFMEEPIAHHVLSSNELKELIETSDFKSNVEYFMAKGFLAPGLLGLKLSEEQRNIVVRLMAFANGVN